MMTRVRYYTDAYGRERTERYPIPYTIIREYSRVMTQPINYTHPSYLTPLGCTVAMLQAVRSRNASLARLYRDHALATSDNPAKIRRIWNLAVAPRPFLP